MVTESLLATEDEAAVQFHAVMEQFGSPGGISDHVADGFEYRTATHTRGLEIHLKHIDTLCKFDVVQLKTELERAGTTRR